MHDPHMPYNSFHIKHNQGNECMGLAYHTFQRGEWYASACPHVAISVTDEKYYDMGKVYSPLTHTMMLDVLMPMFKVVEMSYILECLTLG